ncbi:MAG: hypothetical protein IJ841_09015 [Prevotella sp.]|nr:hypothetical protein [Prevotella sp.]
MKKVITPFALLLMMACIPLFQGCRDFNVTWTPVEYTKYTGRPTIKVYVENSGSMDGYMCEGSELKDAVYSYVSTLGSYADTVELNYINSMIVPFKGDIKTFINNLNAASFKKTGGNKTNSDIADMLDQILKSLRANDIAIFVSDCILDVPQGNAKDYLVNRQIDIRNAFVKKLQEDGNIGVEIFRLESKYSGMYYYYKGGERLTDVKRPYYMWVIGNKHALAHVNRKVPFSQIKHGVVDYFAYSTYEEVPFEITNQFGLVLNPCKCKTSINGQYTIKIQTDLSTMLQEEKMTADVTRYKTQNPRVRVVSVEKISSTKDPNTHVLTLNIDKGISACGEYIKYVQPETPYWLDSANDETGDSIKKNINKTTGIKNIILGVSDAYSEHRELAGVKFVINN